MNFEMSTLGYAVQAVDLLTAVGYQASTDTRGVGADRIVLSVSAYTGVDVPSAERLVLAVDPAARPMT